MANLPLRTRRLLARGFSRRDLSTVGRRNHLGLGNRATLTTAFAGANNDLTFIAKSVATAGNSVTVALVAAGNNTPLTVSVAGTAVTVNLATGGAGAITSTANDVVRAVNFSTTANPLVWAQLAPGNDGTGVVTALAATALSGGTATPAV